MTPPTCAVAPGAPVTCSLTSIPRCARRPGTFWSSRWRKRKFPLVGDGAGYCSWVHLDDAARATAPAVEQKAAGVFNIVDDEPAPAREWLPYLAACAGAKPPMRVPTWLARLLGGEAGGAVS